jgi:hypothetical protein
MLASIAATQAYEIKANEPGSTSTSKKTNNSTVCGPRRTNAGVQPLKRNLGPSSRSERVSRISGLCVSFYIDIVSGNGMSCADIPMT